MPLAGIIDLALDVPRLSRLVQEMLNATRPDSSQTMGSYLTDRLGLAAGWVARRGSFSDCLPAWNTNRTVCLLFVGETFSDGAHDASGLADLYENQGAAFFARLNGWFSGLVVDLRDDTVTLFNDRYGLNRVYFHESRDGFYFASEAKSLLAVLPDLRRIDQRALAEVYSMGCVLQNRSLFPDIFLLPGGSRWIFHRDGRIDKQRYFDPTVWEQQDRLEPEEFTARLIEVFRRIVPRYLGGKEAAAVSLTGGLDSRMLLAWSGAGAGTLPCYSFSGPYRDCADVRIARELARVAEQQHSTLQIEPDFIRDFPSLAEETVRLSDGTMDVSGAVELYVNRKARAIAPVRLTGNYGSEILRSHVAFRPRLLDREFFTPEFGLLLQQAEATYRSEAAGNQMSFIAFKQVPWHHYSRYSIERSQVTPRAPFLDNELVALAYQTPTALAKSVQPLLALITAGNPKLDAVPTDRMLQRGRYTLIQKLQHQWQEFTAKAEYAYDYGMPAGLARFDHCFSRFHLEKLFLGRHKFYHFRIWYRDQLSDYLRQRLDIGNSPSCYRSSVIKRAIHDHCSGRSNHTLEIHRFLTVKSIEDTLLKS